MTEPFPSLPQKPFAAEALTDRATFLNPYPVYAALRDVTPARFESVSGDGSGRPSSVWSWAVMRYRDACQVLRDHQTFSSKDMLAGQLGPRLALIDDDPPRHTRVRRLVSDFFTSAGLARLEPCIAMTSAELLDAMGSGDVELVSAYAAPLPVQIIANLLGIPASEHATFRRWTDAFLNTEPVRARERMRDVREMARYFETLIDLKRSQSAADLIGTLATADIDGQPLERAEVLGFCMLLLIAGNETTTSLVSNACNLLATRPELWQRMRSDRTLIEPVLEETLRFHSPIQRSAFRTATRDCEIAGMPIAAGERVTVFYAAANRDPEAFQAPDEFRPGRAEREHLAFGLGPHFCLGAQLGRLEARITMNTFLDRFSGLELGAQPGKRPQHSPVTFGFERLPLRFFP
ncbi:MAG TPA: cytochrome P450 [Polyangiaceae bacterium]|nr:cytochrome P450 [Polyangiaceae bacterium]